MIEMEKRPASGSDQAKMLHRHLVRTNLVPGAVSPHMTMIGVAMEVLGATIVYATMSEHSDVHGYSARELLAAAYKKMDERIRDFYPAGLAVEEEIVRGDDKSN